MPRISNKNIKNQRNRQKTKTDDQLRQKHPFVLHPFFFFHYRVIIQTDFTANRLFFGKQIGKNIKTALIVDKRKTAETNQGSAGNKKAVDVVKQPSPILMNEIIKQNNRRAV